MSGNELRALSMYERFPTGRRWRTPDGTIYQIVAWGNGKVLVEQLGDQHWVTAAELDGWEMVPDLIDRLRDAAEAHKETT